MEGRNLQDEIRDLENTENIKLLDITAMGGVLSRSMVESSIDTLKDTLGKINLDKIAESVDNDLKGFMENG